MANELGKVIKAELVGNVNNPDRDAAIKAQDWKKVDELAQAQNQQTG